MADSDKSDFEEEQGASLIERVLATVLLPYYLLTSSYAIKAYLTTIIFFFASASLIAVSSIAYLVFYYNYIPPISLHKTLHLQYGLGTYPFATAIIEQGSLISQQPYDVEVVLHLPRTPNNLEAGNFMVDVQLLGPYNPLAESERALTHLLGNISLPTISGLTTLSHSRRPAILPYQSPISRLTRHALHLPLHVLGLQDLDTNTLRVPVFESVSFPRGSLSVPTHVRVELQANGPVVTALGTGAGTAAHPVPLQVYSSKIEFWARFQGLRYIIHRYRITSFFVFTALFYGFSLLTLLVAWSAFSFIFSGKPSDSGVSVKRERLSVPPDSDASIKRESEDHDSGLSPLSIPTGGRGASSSAPQTQQQYIRAGEAADDEDGTDDDVNLEYDDDDDGDYSTVGRSTGSAVGDSGIGTSMESGHEPALVRRRSGRGAAIGRE